MDKGAKITGLLVFVAGVVMLVAVFITALGMLNEARTIQISDIAKQLPREGFVLLAKVLFLFLLGYIASSVAARGIQLFEAGPHEGGETTREVVREVRTEPAPKAPRREEP